MKITPEYCLDMARYNAWQNKQLKAAMRTLPVAALSEERGAFFGSILATANHLLFGDLLWMSRFSKSPVPKPDTPNGTDMTPSRNDWEILRFHTDGQILMWAERLKAVDLAGPLRWQSGILGHEVEKPMSLCVMHMFNHQTHHRGQIHAMLTQAGVDAPVTDLIFMPEDGPWL